MIQIKTFVFILVNKTFVFFAIFQLMFNVLVETVTFLRLVCLQYLCP